MSRLQTHARAIFSVIVFILMRFRPFLTVHTNKICMRFCFDPLSRAFSDRCVFDKNAQRIIVDGRPKTTHRNERVFKRKYITGPYLINVYILLACSRLSDSGEDAKGTISEPRTG